MKFGKPFIKRLLLLIACLLTIASSTRAQLYYSDKKMNTDSLENLLLVSKGENRIDILNELADQYSLDYPDKSDKYLVEALTKSRELGYQKGEGTALFLQGYRHYIDGDIVATIDLYQKAVKVLEEISEKKTLAKVYEHLCFALFFSGADKSKSIELAGRALELYKQIGDNKGLARIYLLLGGGFIRLSEPEKGLAVMDSCFRLIKDFQVTRIFESIAIAVAANCYFQLGQFEKVIEFKHKDILIYNDEILEERSLKAQSYKILGDFFLAKRQIDSALIYLQKGLDLIRSTGNAYVQMTCHKSLGQIYQILHKPNLCQLHCDSALRYAKYAEATGYYYLTDSVKNKVAMSVEIFFPISRSHRKFDAWRIMDATYEILWQLYTRTNEYRKASEIHQPWSAVKDSLFNYNRNRDLLEVQISYETEIKEQRMQKLAEENKLKELKLSQSRIFLLALVALLVLILVFAFLLIRQNRIKTDQKQMQLQQKLLRSQMNPHFIFNSLASIQNTIINEEPEKASTYLARFSKLMRNILDSSVDEFIPLEQEISTIENYLALQKIRFSEKFDYSISVDEEIDTAEIQIPPMLAQPFIENAIEHGFRSKGSIGHIQVSIYHEKRNIIYTIEDDGIGRARAEETAIKLDNNYKSLATQITRERIAVINKKLKQKIRMEIIDLKNEAEIGIGTKVVFRLPVNI